MWHIIVRVPHTHLLQHMGGKECCNPHKFIYILKKAVKHVFMHESRGKQGEFMLDEGKLFDVIDNLEQDEWNYE